MEEKCRCSWAGDVPVYVDYHDNEWGRPTHDDRMLFELLVFGGRAGGPLVVDHLEEARGVPRSVRRLRPCQGGALRRGQGRRAHGERGDRAQPPQDQRGHTNAKLFLDVAREFGSFDAFIWGYVDGEPIVNRWKTQADVPATTPLSDRISEDLKKRGFKFVGSTIVYAYLQSIGIVNDHVVDCFAYRELTS